MTSRRRVGRCGTVAVVEDDAGTADEHVPETPLPPSGLGLRRASHRWTASSRTRSRAPRASTGDGRSMSPSRARAAYGGVDHGLGCLSDDDDLTEFRRRNLSILSSA